jgi:hypothetical protein
MTKFYGNIGYGVAEENPVNSGVWVSNIVEVPSYGDVLRTNIKLVEGSGVNNDLSMGNSISIVADQYMNEHFHSIKYVTWAGANWTITSVTVESPRLIFRLGSVYNGPTA